MHYLIEQNGFVKRWRNSVVALKALKMKTAEFANSVNPDEVADYEPPHLDLHCLHSNFLIVNMIWLSLDPTFFLYIFLHAF